MTNVVHCKKSDYDVYIGRGKCPKTGMYGKWGNPFILGKDGNREEVIVKFREYILNCPDLMNSLHELYEKTLACWCSPLACHGDVLAELVSKYVSDDSYAVFCKVCAKQIDQTLNGKPSCVNGHIND